MVISTLAEEGVPALGVCPLLGKQNRLNGSYGIDRSYFTSVEVRVEYGMGQSEIAQRNLCFPNPRLSGMRLCGVNRRSVRRAREPRTYTSRTGCPVATYRQLRMAEKWALKDSSTCWDCYKSADRNGLPCESCRR